jgi:hypothetical protein
MNRNGIVIPFFRVRNNEDLKTTVMEYVYGTHAAKDI